MPEKSYEAAASKVKAHPDQHLDQSSGARVPTPDPKDQTGDPDESNPPMRDPGTGDSRTSAKEG